MKTVSQMAFETCSDEDLVQACLEGNEAAWEELINRYARLIYTIPLRFGFPQHVADEVFQEVCLILLEKLHTLQNRRRLSSWLMTVTRRVCIRRYRTQPDAPMLDIQDVVVVHPERVEERVMRREEQQILREAMERLDERCRRLLTLLFFDEEDGVSYQEIAELLDMPLGSIGPTRSRCLQKLRRILADMEEEKTSKPENS
ncbi:MAG: sigma-70 family RNA polymerase sigma factor [Ardenticatenia bacterium]|nr:MAG: sigma-70 family RNA polymerase sigma factor [Ardenticatenia bacterium]